MQKILFQGGVNVLSNMAAYAVEWRGEVWMTAEHAYQAAKFEDEEVKLQIRSARSAFDAKLIANENTALVKSNWLEERLVVMEDILRHKISQHPHVRKKILDTGVLPIIEDTDDPFWRRGVSGQGQNQLGQLWMKLRAELLEASS